MEFRTEPYEHQRDALLASWKAPAYALLMEMGTGKSKVALDTAGALWETERITGLLVVAPKGVHANWVNREVPTHCPVEYAALLWKSGMGKRAREDFQALLRYRKERLAILVMNVEAFGSTDRAREDALKFLKAHRCLFVIDESTRIKTPGTRRTKRLLALARYAPYRRILTGMPVTQSPFDFYAQFRFLDECILSAGTFSAFRAHYGELRTHGDPIFEAARSRARWTPQIVKIDSEGRPMYRNLDELVGRIRPYSFRVRKRDCLDLPPKVYEQIPVEMNAAQRHVYRQLEDELKTVLVDHTVEDLVEHLARGSGSLPVPNALARLLRMRQVLGGYVTVDEEVQALSPPCPRLRTLVEATEGLSKAIVWATFRPELEAIAAALRNEHGEVAVVSYHGGIGPTEREAAVNAFQERCGPVRFFVAQPHVGGLGLTLTRAEQVFYYSNDYSYETRVQSEDRAHRIGLEHSVTYVDLIVPGALDDLILNSFLKQRAELAERIMEGVK